MRQIAIHSLLLVLSLLLASPAWAERGDEPYIPDIEYLQLDTTQADLSFEEVRTYGNWQAMTAPSPNFGYVPDVFWFRFSIPEANLAQIERVIAVAYPQLDEVTFFLLQNGELIDHVRTGDHFPYSQRPVDHPHFLFPITQHADNDYEVYIRVHSQGTVQVPIAVWEPFALFEHLSVEDQANAFYYGLMFVIICFNLFIWFALRERMYLYYVLTIASYLLLIATLRGTSFATLWPNQPWLQNQMMLVSVPLAIFFSILFTDAFLKFRRYNPPLHRLARIGAGLSLVALLGSFVLDYNLSIRLSVGLAIPLCLAMLIVGPMEWYRGNRAARYYTIAWAMLTLGGSLAALSKWGWLPTNFVTEFGIQIGSALEAILLSLALAERLYREREERVTAQDERLREHAERRQAELRLMDQALHHPITGLPNRTCFEMLVRDTLQQDSQRRHAVGVIQLMNYQAIHKTLGHTNTDRLLKTVAGNINRLARQVPGIHVVEQTDREQYCSASLETASFAFLLDPNRAAQYPRQIRELLDELREPVEFLGMRLPLDPVAGVAVFPEHGQDPNTLIRRAYIAQESEDSSERRVAFYRTDRDIYSADRLTMVSELKHALEQEQLELYLQPKLDLRQKAITGAEALLRWPNRVEAISPDTIVAVAEETGLIKPLTRWVMEKTLALRDQLLAAGYDLDVSLNISANNLREPDFPLFAQKLLNHHPNHRGRIALELTETSMMRDPITSLKTLRALHSAGIPISVDDFGSGYSSLSYIKQLPATEIKIDKSLITDLLEHPDDRVIVQTTIDMCHSLGYRVVAEGVENGDTLELLQHIGCNQIQGFLMTPALPVADFIHWLNTSDYPAQAAPELR